MQYIIYFDSNYLQYLKYEIGEFVILGDGVGLYDREFIKKTDLGLYFSKIFDILNCQRDVTNLTTKGCNDVKNAGLMQKNAGLLNENAYLDAKMVLDASIFVRHYHKVDAIWQEFDYDTLKDILLPYKDYLLSIRVVYGKGTKFKGLTQVIAEYLEKDGFQLNIKSPECVLSIFAGDKIYFSLDRQNELPTNYRAGAPHYAEGKEISRAEFKLLEAFDRFKIDSQSVKNAIDLGASPGGWTHALASLGINVSAVDPANLDERVLKMKNVKHFKMLSQDYLKICKDKFDLIVDDMKMFGDKSAHIVCNCTPLLNKNAKLLMTIKLAKDKLYNQIYDAIRILSEQFEIVSVKKLFYTRQEVIVFAKLKK